jgi:NTP pyrophosphatase (non-canonical NTP hydrolase)
MYYIYHIPGKKIGVTRDLNKRVTAVQGYTQNEYEVLDASTDINYISDKELRLQKHFGYKVDIRPYKELVKSSYMKTHTSSDATTTFKISLNEINAEFLTDLVVETSLGTFVLDAKDKIDWVLNNLHPSQYGPGTCYIYNKAMSKEGAFQKLDKNFEPYKDTIKVDFDAIRRWANARGIVEKGDTKTQLIKLYEETGELSEAILKNNKEDIIDAIGDSVIVLTNLAEMAGTNIEDCIISAYNEISARTGRMINGTFVKDTI